MPGKIIFWDKRYTANTPKENPDIVFVFGDNLQGRGKGGQAVLRDNPNVLGVPTKRYPGRSQGDYFTGSPDEARAVTNSIDEIDRLVKAGKTVAIPVDGGQISLGTGLAELNTRAPELLSYIQGSINQIAGAGDVGPRMSAEVHSSKGDLNYLSNFADVQGGFEFNGRRYRTVEGAYQSLKSGQYVPGFEGLTGSQAKSKGRSVRVDRATNEKLMMDLLSARAQQDPAFRDMLSSTGQQKLTHTVGDKFWAQKFPEILEQVRGGVGPSRAPGLKKIISGMQSGGDLFGLEAAQKLGIQTGGYGAGASGAVTKDSSGRNIEAPELRDKFGIAPVPPEIQQQFEQRYGKATGARGLWLPRTYANVLSSDATVYFITKDNSAGLAATKRYADDLGKPFLIVDERKPEDMKKLAEFSAANNIEVLNIAGNRELSNPAFVEQAISGAFGPSDLTSNLPMDPEQLIRNQQAAEMGKQLFGYQIEPGIGRYPGTFKEDPRYKIQPTQPKSWEDQIRHLIPEGSYMEYPLSASQSPEELLEYALKGLQGYSAEDIPHELIQKLSNQIPISPSDYKDLIESRWVVNPETGELTSKAIDPSKELAIEAVGPAGTPTKYGEQLPFSSYGITTGQPVGPGKSSEILSASQLKRIGGMETLEQQLEALRDIVYDRGIQAHNEIKQNALNYLENTAATAAGTKTIAGKIRDAQAGGKFSGATSEDLIDQMATGIADQALTGQGAGQGTTTFEDPDKVLMRALVNSDIPFEQDPDAASSSEGYKIDTEAAFIENMGDKKRFDPTVNTRPIEQLSPGERLAASLQGATGIPPLSESEIMKLAGEINRVKAGTVRSFADQPEQLLSQAHGQQMVWNPKTKKYESTVDYTGKKLTQSPLEYLSPYDKGARGTIMGRPASQMDPAGWKGTPQELELREILNQFSSPANPQAMPPMDIGLGSNAGAVLGEQTGPRINPDYQQQLNFGDPAPQDFGNDGWKFHLNATKENLPKIYQILDRYGVKFKGPGASHLSQGSGYDYKGSVKDLLDPKYGLPSKPVTVYGYKDSGLFGRDQMMDLVNKLGPELEPLITEPTDKIKSEDVPILGNIYGRFDATSRSENPWLGQVQQKLKEGDIEWLQNAFQRYGQPGYQLLARDLPYAEDLYKNPEKAMAQKQRAFDRLSELYGDHFLGTGENKFTPEFLAKNPEAEDLIRQIVDVDRTTTGPSFDAADMQQTFDVNQDKSFDLTGTSPTDSPVMQALPVAGPPTPMEALPVTNNAKLKQKLKDPVGTMKGAGEWAIDKAKNNIITRTGGKVNNFFDLPADSPLRMKIDEMAGDSKLKQGLGRSVRFGASLPGTAGRMGMPKAISLDSLADIVELAKGAYKVNQYEKFGTPKDLVIGRDVQNYDELIAHLVGRNTDAHDGNGLAYITPDQAERLIGLKNELTSAYQRGEIKEAEEHPNYKTMRKLINEFTKNREDGPQGAFNRSINVLEPSSSDEMGWMSQWRKEVQAGQDNFIDEPEAQLTPYGMFHVPIWSDVTGRAGSVQGVGDLGSGMTQHLMNPGALPIRIAEGVLGDNASSYASLGDGFVRSPNYDTIRLRGDVDAKSLLGSTSEEKQKIIYDGTPYTNTRYWKWNPDSRTLVNRYTGTSVREEDTGIQNFGEKMRNWNSYTQKLREAQSRGKGEGTFSGEGVTSQVAQIEKDFEALPMFSRQDHGHRTRGSEDIPDILSPFTDPAWENLPWYAKAAQAGSYMTDKLGDHKDSIVEGVKGMFGSGQIDETDDPFSSENVIRIYRQTGDNPAHVVGYNRQQASPSMFDNPVGGYLSDAERLLKNTIPYWEHKESKYSDIYKLIGEGE